MPDERDEDTSPALPVATVGQGAAPMDPALTRLAAAARAYAAAKDSANTAGAYASDWRLFARWCRRHGFDADESSPQTVGLYLAASADGHGIEKAAVSTIERRLSAICAAYRAAGTPLDRGDRHIASVMAGIRRTHARPPRQKEAVLGEDLLAMIATLPVDLRGIRDRAILLVGFAGALRRSEIVGLDCGPGETQDGGGWIEVLPDGQDRDGGLLLTVRGKTGWRTVEVGRGSSDRSCPVVALETWLRLGRIAHGPVFRSIAKANGGVAAERLSDKRVARLVQKTAMAAGIRGDLAEGARRLAFGPLPPGRSRDCRRSPRLAPARPRLRRDDACYKRRRDRFSVNLTRAAGL